MKKSKKCRIALVQPYCGEIVCPPLALAYLAANAKENGHEVLLIDLQLPNSNSKYEEVLRTFAPDIVGFTAMTPQIAAANSLARKAKSVLKPEVLTILGGIHGSVLPDETLRLYDSFDIIVIGEGDETLVKLCDEYDDVNSMRSVEGVAYLDKSSNKVVINKKALLSNLNQLPFPHYEYNFCHYLKTEQFLPHGVGFAAMMASRGCPFPCTFCAANRYGRRYRTRNPNDVVDESEKVISLGARGLYFMDSTFMTDRKWCIDICNVLRPLNVKWCVDGRVDLVDRELLEIMAASGCYAIFYGIESGSQKILDYYKKNTTVNRCREILKLTRECGIRTTASFILGAPIETREDIEMTVNFILDTKPSYYAVGILSPMPGSKIYDDLIKSGHEFHYDKLTRDHATISTSGVTKEELEKVMSYLKKVRPQICESWVEIK